MILFLADDSTTFRKLAQYLKTDPPIASITANQMRGFLSAQRGISKKTFNMHVGLSALWTWTVHEGIVPHHVLHDIPAPRPEQRAIEPFTKADVRAMLSSLDKSKAYSRPGKRECNHRLGSSLRDQAVLLVLVDTGLRASELCELRIRNVDLNNRRLVVLGKGSKERIIPFSVVTSQAIWRYQATRPKDSANDFLFVTAEEQPLDRVGLGKLILRIGERTGVTDADAWQMLSQNSCNVCRVQRGEQLRRHQAQPLGHLYLMDQRTCRLPSRLLANNANATFDLVLHLAADRYDMGRACRAERILHTLGDAGGESPHHRPAKCL